MSNANGGPDPRGATIGAARPDTKNGAAPPDPLRDGPLAGARRRILRHLERHGPDRLGPLPRSWPVTRLHVSALLEPLFRAGLVRRDRDPRGRMVVGLTTEGRRRA